MAGVLALPTVVVTVFYLASLSAVQGHTCYKLDLEDHALVQKDCVPNTLERCTYSVMEYDNLRALSSAGCIDPNCYLISDDKYCKLGCRDITDRNGNTIEWCVCEGSDCNEERDLLDGVEIEGSGADVVRGQTCTLAFLTAFAVLSAS